MDSLYRLVKSLSKSEKRYFSLFRSQDVVKGKKNYSALYEALEKEKDYDEQTFREKYKDEGFCKNFSYEKNYLRKQILRAMRSYHEERDIGGRINDLLRDAHLLENKGIYDLCFKQLRKARKLATKYERFTQLLEILDWERRLLKQDILVSQEEKLRGLIAEKEEILEILRNRYQVLDLHDRLFLLNRRSAEYSQEEIVELMSPLAKDLSDINPESVHAAIDLNYSFWLFYLPQKNYPKAVDALLKVKQLWEEHPHLIREHPISYKICLSNLLTTFFYAEQYEEVEPIIQLLKDQPADSFNDAAETFQNIYFFELLLRLNTGDLSDRKVLTSEIRSGLDRYWPKVNKARELSMSINLALIHLLAGKPREGLEWVRRILDSERSEHRRDIQAFARIMMLILHWELNNPDVVELQLRNFENHLKKLGEMTQFEKIVFRAFRMEVKAAGTADQGTGWEKAISQLEKEKLPRTGSFEVTFWIRAQLENRIVGEKWRELFNQV